MSTILCVEDDQETASLLAEALTELGYEVDTAQDGEMALARILAKHPDLILCDVRMPRMGGFELVEKLARAGPTLAAIPVVFLTALGDRDSELTGRRLGADDYLTQPIDFEMLGVVVENCLRRGGGRSGEVVDVLVFWRSGRTDRPAVDARAGDRDEETPVESRVARASCPIADLAIPIHLRRAYCPGTQPRAENGPGQRAARWRGRQARRQRRAYGISRNIGSAAALMIATRSARSWNSMSSRLMTTVLA